MTLKRLLVQHLRNLISVNIEPCDRVNLIYGENGSGKTSLLEAINLLALGRSFRSHKHKPLINNGQDAFTIFGKVVTHEGADIPIGINRQLDGTASFKANGLQLSSAAELATYLPVQVINSNTFLLLEGSPQVRRQFMDWLVFHVEPKFYQAWKDCERCLKHRNSLLRRDRIDEFELAIWDQELAMLSEQIHQYRQACMEQFLQTFNELLQEFISVDGLAVHYYRGWDKDKSYRELLQTSIQRDHQLGYTHSGIHRADLRITLRGQNAAEVLSRGQQKLLVCALKIAQGLVFTRLTGRKTVYLVDDLPAELDEKHRQLLAHWLDIMATQVFITGVEQETLRSTWQLKPEVTLKVFHVEHGEVKVAGQ